MNNDTNGNDTNRDDPELQERQLKARFELSDEQTDAVFTELFEKLDEWAAEAVLLFKASDGEPASVRKKFHLKHFVDALDPYLEEAYERISNLLPEVYPDGAGEPYADLNYIDWKREKLGYIIGVIAGAKFAGAPAEKLERLRRAAKSMV